jgi:hypothetical protein
VIRDIYEKAVMMGSDAIKYILNFMRIGSRIQKLLEGDTNTDTHSHAVR